MKTINNTSRRDIENYLIDTGYMSDQDIDDWSTIELRQMIKDAGREEVEAFEGYIN